MSNEKQESVADIVAWIRDVAQSYRNTPISKGIAIEGLVVCDALEGIADRIEAAWKRERGAAWNEGYDHAKRDFRPIADELERLRNTPAGNAAAMREALVRVCGWLERMNKERLDAFAESQITPAYAVNRQAKTIIEDNEYHIGQINAALASPPRNCDVYGPKADIYGVYCYWISTPEGHDPEGRPTMSYGSWLLANAKGGKCDAGAKQD